MRPRVAAVLIASLACVAIAAPVSADFGPTQVLRKADSVLLQDVAARGSGVGVVWQEEPAGGPAIMVRISQDGGATFAPRVRLDGRPNRSASAAICAGTLWVASELHVPGEPADRWDIVVDGRSLDGTITSGHLLTDPYASVTARDPAIACVGNRFLAVVWLEKLAGAPWHARLSVFDPTPSIEPALPSSGAEEVRLDLGTGMRAVEPAVDATNGRVVAAWGRSGKTVLQRFSVAPGAGVSLSASARQAIDLDPDYSVKVAIAGQRVVVAYTRDNDLYTRRSTNGGSSFSGRVKRIDGDATCCFVGYPNSLDIVGARVLLLAGKAYGDVDVYTEQWRFRSADGGATFSRRKVGTKGERMGAYRGSAAAPRIVEAWDDWTDWEGPNRIRFHRES